MSVTPFIISNEEHNLQHSNMVLVACWGNYVGSPKMTQNIGYKGQFLAISERSDNYSAVKMQ